MTEDTDQLQRTLAGRAARADREPDADAVLTGVVAHAAHRRHRRRTSVAAGAASLGVVAIVAGSLYLGRADSPTAQPAGGPPGTGQVVPEDDGLVSAPPAPAAAEASLGLVPDGWAYLGYAGGATTYGPAGSNPDPSTFAGKLAVLVGERYDSGADYPLTIAGRPGRYDDAPGTDGRGVSILLPDQDGVHLSVIIQVPDSAGLDRDAILRMADTLDVRATTEYGVG